MGGGTSRAAAEKSAGLQGACGRTADTADYAILGRYLELLFQRRMRTSAEVEKHTTSGPGGGKKTNLVRPRPTTAGMGGFVWEELPLAT